MSRTARLWLALVFSALTSAGAIGAETKPAMFDTLINIINKSDLVLSATVRASEPVTAGGQKFVRAQGDVVEVFKGAPPGKAIAYDVEFANKETPQTTTGETYILFLRKGSKGEEAGRYFLVDLSSPLRIREEKRELYPRLIRDYVAVAQAEPARNLLKPHLLNVLDCGIPFFEEDAAKTALLTPDWTAQQIEQIRKILAGTPHRLAPSGNERDNLVTLVISQGTRQQAEAQGRIELAHHDADSVYYGLSRRPGDADALLADYLQDSDGDVQLAAIRLAGLLRKGEILSQFERDNGASLTDSARHALAEARKLVNRD